MPNAMPQSPSSSPRVLVVDDDATIRLLCSRTLKEAGYEVLEAEGSSEAMELMVAGKQPVDLLVVDLFLPPPGFQLASSTSKFQRVNGHEMVQQLLELTKELRVLFISSHAKTGLADQGIKLGNAPFLPKPIGKEALLHHVKSALEAPPLHHNSSAVAKTDDMWVD